ncbi:hypothetical protein WJX72_012315 [[Myrmecia] bisecta]|uniref:Uncharacterized protein n=1 Tax=[Myrmecia] bisecta TaxID=41462 RepID=A0AAW1Q5X2_9CHLO
MSLSLFDSDSESDELPRLEPGSCERPCTVEGAVHVLGPVLGVKMHSTGKVSLAANKLALVKLTQDQKHLLETIHYGMVKKPSDWTECTTIQQHSFDNPADSRRYNLCTTGIVAETRASSVIRAPGPWQPLLQT